MVMVVIHSVLVASGGTHRLDASKKSVTHEHPQGVIDRLARNGADVRLRDIRHLVRSDVRLARNGPEHRDALSGRLDATLAELFDRTHTHVWHRNTILDRVQLWNDSRVGGSPVC